MLCDRSSPGAAMPSAGGGTVVVVDDDDGLRAAMLRVLDAAGLEARGYANAEELLAERASQSATCLVVDLDLPGMSGLDLVDLLRHRGVTAPALVISAHPEPRVRAAAGRHGIERVLAKPFLGHTLVQAVHEMLARRS
jgi:FixJ family two-component response regulator